ncbi:HAMP domain-containing sensor histidine kinase [Bradyrhizobium sp. URHD0069]|uniref:sensor histidine kinase n=1 Tax=Bradyrhizobium sp. URHD0069 TaxID=1380355 RepID=UPI0004980B59|nr:HAMP domain-containing sensor histidine kinase [Bradyrhizobium sp. URHD0069]
MNLPEFVRTTTFRSAALAAGAFAIFVIVLFGFIYWTTDRYLVARSDHVIALQLKVISTLPGERKTDAIDYHLKADPRGVQFVGLFRPDGSRTAGNLESLPPGLKLDDSAQSVEVKKSGANGVETRVVRAIGKRLPGGDVLVIGRNVDEAIELLKVVGQALALGLIPALVLCLAVGALLSVRAEKRIADVNQRVQRIVAGNLRERLPGQARDDPFSKLAAIVNGMLDEIETLIHAIAGIGNDIAHDLRRPLARVRLILERGRSNAKTLEQLQLITDRAVTGIDQSLAIATALLRLAEIENSRKSAGFGKVALADLVREVGELYDPIAENKGITLHIDLAHAPTVDGDRDLLMEAVVNLVDNAVKFTPEGGRVDIALLRGNAESIVRIKDTGSGISEHERDIVLKRFYRSDKLRSAPGFGLGLNLVAAIVKLHGFRLTIYPGSGCVVEIASPDQRADGEARPERLKSLRPVAPPNTRVTTK